MANKKISQLTSKSANLAATDLVEISEFSGSGYVSKRVTGQEIIDGVLANASNGTVTSVTGGTGLNGGTITTSGTLSVKYGTTSGTAAEGNDSRLSDSRPPTGTAGGDLSGTYPSPTVDGLQGQPVSNATPVNGQVLQYDGTTWVPGSIPSGGSGGGGVVYYLNFNTAADAPLANIPQTPNTSKELGITAETTATSYTSGILSTANYDFLASFVTDLNTPSSISIPAGLWDFNIYAKSTTSNAANQTSFKIEVFKYDGSNAPVSLAVSNEIFIYDPTEITQYVASVILPQTTILNTDRIVVYLYGKAHQNNNTLTFHFGGGYPSHVHSTIPSVTGTGVVKVVNSVFQSPASTIVNSDVSATANIEVSKLSMSSNRILGRTAAGSGSVEEISLGVTGNSGSATLSGNTLNIPTYTLAGLGGVPTSRLISTTAPLSGGGDLSADRTLSISDAVANGTTKGAATFTASDFSDNGSGVISLDYASGQKASASQDGFLSSSNWSDFNGKQNQLNGTGFVKASGTTITYDNSTYLTSAITSLNGLTASTQTFATPGTTGTAPNWNSATSAHTLNIPSANASGVTAGLISNTEFTTFNNKVSTGAITGSGLTMATSRLLGRTTALSGAVEEITLGTGLSFSGTTLNATISSGAWGIANTSGVYTYYNNLTSAMSAATSGQTIEMFADITETGNVTISLKSGVIINGNGHTYTYTNNSGVMFSFTSSTAGNLAFYNINITRTNTASTGAAIFSFINNSVFINSRIDFSGCVIRYNVTSGNSPVFICDSIHSFTINNLNCITNGGGTTIASGSSGGTINNCYIECKGTGGGFSGGIAKQCIIITQSGIGVSGSSAGIYECVINCLTSGIGVQSVSSAYNCIVTTNTGYCFDGSLLGSQTVYDCVARSTSGVCFYSTIAQNSQAYSATGNAISLHSNYGDGRYKYYNCFLYSAGAIVSNSGAISLLNCTIVSGWNNAGGHAVRMSGTTLNEIANCVIDVANASANCINSTAAATVKYANTSFRTSTTPVNANITQGLTNTQDNQGNILL